MKKWYVSAKKADFKGIGEKFGIDPVIARIIRNRDILTDEDIDAFLHPGVDKLIDPSGMADIQEGANLLLDEIRSESRIRIIGDYDVDGICATFVLFKGISALGGRVDFDIPDRIKDGYGLNRDIIERAHDEGIEVIVTCDNGISAAEEIAYAKELGMRVIVTDHHEIPFALDEAGEKCDVLPPADAVINPHRQDCKYPFKGLCGAVVAFKFMQQAFMMAGRDTAELTNYMDVLALATVADVMDLGGENRTIVCLGLKKLGKTDNIGLNALMDVNGLMRDHLGAYHIGFVIGPCINAVGRLDTAKTAVKLLLSEDKETAAGYAKELFDLNAERKGLTEEGVDRAIEQIENNHYEDNKVMVVYLPGIHESIAGIIAGRIKERYYRPVLILTDGDGAVKGSGRSIEEYNMFEGLTSCKDLFVKFGGHAMAAGVTLAKENVDTLRSRLNEETTLTDEDIIPKLKIDVPMPIGYVSENLIGQLDILEPFGKGNPRPVFAQKDVQILEARIMGKNSDVLKLKICDDSGRIVDGVRFREDGSFRSFIEEKYGKEEADKLFRTRTSNVKVSVAYYPTINEYRGVSSISIHIEDYC